MPIGPGIARVIERVELSQQTSDRTVLACDGVGRRCWSSVRRMMQRLSVSAAFLVSIPELKATPDRKFARVGLRRLLRFSPGSRNMQPTGK